MEMVKAPDKVNWDNLTVFLAGSIDMGEAEDWQTKIGEELQDLNVTFVNPRRDDWDSSWVQSIDNPQFNEQVSWELTGIERSDVVAMYLADGSKSPISLLELGLAITDPEKVVIVYCTDKFYRKGNIDIVCERFNIPVYETWEDFVNALRDLLENV